MSEYIMFYIKDDKSPHWVELDSFSRSCEMFQICRDFVDWEKWHELTAADISGIDHEISDYIRREHEIIKRYESDNEFLKSLNRPADEIIELKNGNDSMIAECEDTLKELESALNEIRLFAAFVLNSQYSDNKVHICLAHECSPNADDNE